MAELFGIITAAIGTVDIVANRIQQITIHLNNASNNPQEWTHLSNQHRIFKSHLDSLKTTLTSTSSISSQHTDQLVTYLCDIDSRFKSMNEGLISMENRLNISNQSKQSKQSNQVAKKNIKISTRFREALSNTKRSAKKLAMANADADMMKELQQNLDHGMGIMLQISNHVDLAAMMEQTTISQDSFRKHFDAPVVPPRMYLDLKSTDENGKYLTHEGQLKHHILSIAISSSQRDDISTGSTMKNVCTSVCACGTGGMGKSITLRYLCHDEEIQDRFKDGIHFMTLGDAAGCEDVIRVLSRCVRNSGFSETASKIGDCKAIEEAVGMGAEIFRERKMLIVVDDLWPTEGCNIGYLAQFQSVMSQSPESILLISTRDEVIGKMCTKRVEFEELEPLGTTATSILLEQVNEEAVKAWRRDPSSLSALDEILVICGGMKLMLAIVGCGINEEIEDDDEKKLSEALIRYKKDVEVNRGELIHSKAGDMYESNLRVVVCRSLDQCERLRRSKKDTKIGMKCHELFESLCVMEKQKGMPLVSISRLWEMESVYADRVLKYMKRMNLVRRNVRKVEDEDGEEVEAIWISMHDLVLDVSRYFGEEGKGMKGWHREFLRSYMEKIWISNEASIEVDNESDEKDMEWDENSVGEEGLSEGFGNPGRWDLESEEYVFFVENVCRLLDRAELRKDLLRLLTTYEWTIIRKEIGGWAGLNADYNRGTRAYEDMSLKSRSQKRSRQRQIANELRTIQRVLLDWWSVITDSCCENTIGCFVHGSLSEEERSVNVRRYLESIAKHGPIPWIKPRRVIYDIDERQVFVDNFEFGSYVNSSCSTMGFAAYYYESNEVSWFRFSDMCFTHRLTVDVSDCDNICVSPNGKLILAKSNSGTVCIWDMQNGSRIAELFTESRADRDLSVCAFDNSENRMVCLKEDNNLIVYENGTGKWQRTRELIYSDFVLYILFSGDGRYLASSSIDLHVYIWDMSTDTPKIVKALSCIYIPSSLAFNGNGNLLAIGNRSNVLLWNWMDSEHTSDLLQLDMRMVKSINFSTNDDFLVTGSHSSSESIRVWDVQTGKQVCNPINCYQSRVARVQFSEDSRHIISLFHDGSIRKWEFLPTNIPHSTMPFKNRRVKSTSISDDGVWIGTGFVDGSLQIYETNNNGHTKWMRKNSHQDSITYISFSDNCQQVASTGLDGYVRVWDVATGNLKTELRERERYLESAYCVAFNNNGDRLISGYSDGIVCIWDIQSTRLESSSRKPENRFHCYGEIANVAVSQNERLVSCVSKEGWMHVWDTVTGKRIGKPRNVRESILLGLSESEVQKFHKTDEARFFLCFSKDDLMIMCTMRVQDIRGIAVWEAATSRQIGTSLSFKDWNPEYVADRYEEWINKLVLELKNNPDMMHYSRRIIEREVIRNLEKVGVIVRSDYSVEGTSEELRCERACDRLLNTRLYIIDEIEVVVSTMNGMSRRLLYFPVFETVSALVHADTNRIFWHRTKDSEFVYILDIVEEKYNS